MNTTDTQTPEVPSWTDSKDRTLHLCETLPPVEPKTRRIDESVVTNLIVWCALFFAGMWAGALLERLVRMSGGAQ